MPAIKVATSFNIELEFEVPEFYRRLVALLIDAAILWIYIRIAEGLFANMEYPGFNDEAGWVKYTAIKYMLEVPYLIYFPLLEILTNGQSVGKKVMGLRVVTEDGGRISAGQIAIRWLVRDIWILFVARVNGSSGTLEGFMVMGMIGFLVMDIVMVVSSKKGQRIGDMLAHTILIRTTTESDINQTVFQEVADNYVPAYPQIMQLSDRDINAIKSILEIARRKGDFSMAENASNKVKNHLHIESNLSPFDFLEVLLKDYNYLSTK
ncbi:MAG TPA: RDD family protein [Chitinophagaceae bacterium]|jgi:uncharacterized RDD family membrane protein YckC|nr:RDD family protein [Chitinophagaceae bacterium]